MTPLFRSRQTYTHSHSHCSYAFQYSGSSVYVCVSLRNVHASRLSHTLLDIIFEPFALHVDQQHDRFFVCHFLCYSVESLSFSKKMCFDSRCPKFYELNYLVAHTKYLPLSWISQLCWTPTILADENFHTMINFRIRNFIVLLAFYEGGILRAEHLDILWMRIFFFAMNCSRSLTRSLNETKAHTHTYLYVRHTFARYRHVNGTPYYFKSHIFENGVAIFFRFPMRNRNADHTFGGAKLQSISTVRCVDGDAMRFFTFDFYDDGSKHWYIIPLRI